MAVDRLLGYVVYNQKYVTSTSRQRHDPRRHGRLPRTCKGVEDGQLQAESILYRAEALTLAKLPANQLS